MKILESMRIIGSILIVASYFVVLHVNTTAGVIIHLVADVCTIPYFVKKKTWDMVIMLMFLSAIGIKKLI
jgi:hypothetical protein